MESRVKLTKLDKAFTNHILLQEIIQQLGAGREYVTSGISLELTYMLQDLGYKIIIK